MNNRIYSLLGMFETEEAFIDKSKMNIEYLIFFDCIDYSRGIPIFSKLHQESCAYLDACLKHSNKAMVQRGVKNE